MQSVIPAKLKQSLAKELSRSNAMEDRKANLLFYFLIHADCHSLAFLS
jgi:hypothetical protein